MYFFLVPAFMVLFGNATGFFADFFRSTECPLAWTEYYGCDFYVKFQGTCYCLFNSPLSFEQANTFCKGLDSQLAMPKTKEINDFLVNELLSNYKDSRPIWIGLNDQEEEGKFVWIDGTPVRWTNWEDRCARKLVSRDEQQVEDCVAMSPANGGTWEDFECSYKTFNSSLTRTFVCEYRYNARESDTQGNGAAESDENDSNEPCGGDDTVTSEEKDDVKTEEDDKGHGANGNSGHDSTGANDNTQCPVFDCHLNCFVDGYVTNSTTGCPLCECDIEK